jgi:hypothetical protein
VQSEAECTLAACLERGAPDRPAPERAPDRASSVRPSAAERPPTRPSACPPPCPLGPSLADEILPGASASALARARNVAAGLVVASEAQIAEAMAHAYRDMGLVLEGTAALALAPVLFGLPEPVRGGDLVVVLTGRNVDSEVLLRYA